MSYVESPTGRIVNVHFKKKKPEKPPGCGGFYVCGSWELTESVGPGLNANITNALTLCSAVQDPVNGLQGDPTEWFGNLWFRLDGTGIHFKPPWVCQEVGPCATVPEAGFVCGDPSDIYMAPCNGVTITHELEFSTFGGNGGTLVWGISQLQVGIAIVSASDPSQFVQGNGTPGNYAFVTPPEPTLATDAITLSGDGASSSALLQTTIPYPFPKPQDALDPLTLPVDASGANVYIMSRGLLTYYHNVNAEFPAAGFWDIPIYYVSFGHSKIDGICTPTDLMKKCGDQFAQPPNTVATTFDITANRETVERVVTGVLQEAQFDAFCIPDHGNFFSDTGG
jgi:hypothetical protein